MLTEDQKDYIITTIQTADIFTRRFYYSNSNDWFPPKIQNKKDYSIGIVIGMSNTIIRHNYKSKYGKPTKYETKEITNILKPYITNIVSHFYKSDQN